jgi:NodT family efflux transporter outer membrane factor (OMF) lipoprotein
VNRPLSPVVATLTIAAGCLPYDAVERAAPPTPELDQYVSGGENEESSASTGVDPWWEAFDDPTLNAIEERALGDNFQLRAAWARLSQARALAEQAGAPKWPQVDLQLRASRQRQVFGSVGVVEFSSYGASVPVAYEIDLFNRIGATATAAELDARATRDDVEALAITISAEVAEAYFDLIEIRQRKTLLESQLASAETFAELTELRFQTGQASALEVYQQRSNVQGRRAQIALLDGQAAQVENQLLALVGDAPGTEVSEGPDALPELGERPRLGTPSSLLARRPDVRSAQRRVSAADYRVGAAIADRFPKLQLQGNIGFGATDLAQLFSDVVWSLIGSISQSIIDGGRRAAEVDRNEAIVQERLEQFGQTVITALVEVDTSVKAERAQVANIEELEQQYETLDATLTEARNRYRSGLTDYLNVLTALVAKQNAEVGLLTARRQLLSNRIQLHRAIGGAWTQRLLQPEPREVRDLDEEAEEEDES